MTRNTQLVSFLACTAAAAALLASGCASAPPLGEFQFQPDGTVIQFHRVSSGSYGKADGPVVWTQSRDTWQGKPVVKAASNNAGINLVDPSTHGLIATLNNAGQPMFSFEPPLAYAWPLEVGKAWTSQHTMTVHAAKRQVPMTVSYRVEALEDVTVPAGTFKTFRVVTTDNFGEVQRVWTAPYLGLGTVKRILDRSASHPNGAGHLEGVLTSRTLPK